MSTNSMAVTSGVPQGSILAPYLFASVMGTLQAAVSTTKIIKYADDVTLLISFTNHADLEMVVKTETQNMKTWCESHGLVINENKTKTLLFTKAPCSSLTPSLPNIEPHLSTLGITFEASLKWNVHVASIAKKASRRIYALTCKSLKRIPLVTKADLRQVYCNYILSVIEYNSPLMVGMSSKNDSKLDYIRKRCHRIICGLDCRCSDFTSISERRKVRAMKYFDRLIRIIYRIAYSLTGFLILNTFSSKRYEQHDA